MSKILMFCLLFLLSCSMGFLRRDKPDVDNSVPVVTEPTPTQPSLPAPGAGDPVLEPIPPETTVPVAPVVEALPEYKLKMNVKFYGSAATTKRIAKYKQAMLVCQKVVSSKEFMDKVKAHKKYNSTALGFTDSSDKGEQVLEKLYSGAEKLQPTKDGEVDIEIEFYYAANSTVGYTYPNSKRIWVNTKFYDGYALPSVAANLIHEYLHKLGYGHAVSYSKSRDYSVPYGVGAIMRSLGSKYD
jgi:hypothetical protein